MIAAIVISAVFGYLLIGAAWAGLVTRTLESDEIVLACVIAWPLIMTVALGMFVYSRTAGREFPPL